VVGAIGNRFAGEFNLWFNPIEYPKPTDNAISPQVTNIFVRDPSSSLNMTSRSNQGFAVHDPEHKSRAIR